MKMIFISIQEKEKIKCSECSKIGVKRQRRLKCLFQIYYCYKHLDKYNNTDYFFKKKVYIREKKFTFTFIDFEKLICLD